MNEQLPPLSGGNASIFVSNMEGSVRFYTGTLGFRLRVRFGDDWAEIEAGDGLVIGLHPAAPPRTVPAGTSGAINLELSVRPPNTLDEVVKTLTARGARFQGPIEDYPKVRLARLLDPDDNVVFLAQQVG